VAAYFVHGSRVGSPGGSQGRVDGTAWFQIRVRGNPGREVLRRRVLPVVLVAPPKVAHPEPARPLPVRPLPVRPLPACLLQALVVLPHQVARPSAQRESRARPSAHRVARPSAHLPPPALSVGKLRRHLCPRLPIQNGVVCGYFPERWWALR